MKLLVVFSVLAVGAFAQQARFDNFKVYRVVPTTETQLLELQKLTEDDLLDFWLPPGLINKNVDVMVPPHKEYEFLTIIGSLQIAEKVQIENVQKLIDEEREDIKQRAKKMDWKSYHTLKEFDKWMKNLPNEYKDIVTRFEIGKTSEKRKIWALEIIFQPNQKTCFIESGIHAREWITPAASSYLVKRILESPANSTFRKFNYIYVPFFNPDGYAYSWTTDRMWVKTRSVYPDGDTLCYGVDMNRNFNIRWFSRNKTDPCNNAYAGPHPVSEIETKYLAEFIDKNASSKDIKIYLAFQGYSQVIAYPWGCKEHESQYEAEWNQIATAAVKEIRDVTGASYNVGELYHTISPTNGTLSDYIYDTQSTFRNFVFRLRDEGEYGHLLPGRYIEDVGLEVMVAVEKILEQSE